MDWATAARYLDAIRMHSSDLFLHSLNVANLALRIATEVGMDGRLCEVLLIGALLHDLGKTEISPAVLNKTGPLTAEEWLEIKRHPIAGVERLASAGRVELLLLDLVLLHHERWDGKGYFRHAGPGVSLPVRILILADALDAMTSRRPYQPARTWRDALKEMLVCAGTQFDPGLVQALQARPYWQTESYATPGGYEMALAEEKKWLAYLQSISQPVTRYLRAVQQQRILIIEKEWRAWQPGDKLPEHTSEEPG